MKRGLSFAYVPLFCLVVAAGMKILPLFLPAAVTQVAMSQHLKKVVKLSTSWDASAPDDAAARGQRIHREWQVGMESEALLISCTSIFCRGVLLLFTIFGFLLWLGSPPCLSRRIRHA